MSLATNLTPDITGATPDDALLAAAARGDRAALGILYMRHADALRATAAAVLGRDSETSADDVVHDVLLVLLEGRAGAFEPARGKALVWLKGIARRAARAYADARLSEVEPPPNAERVGQWIAKR